MTEFIGAIAFFMLMMLGMSLGLIFAGKALTGSCGGKGKNCDFCDKPEEEKAACEKKRMEKKSKKMSSPKDYDLT